MRPSSLVVCLVLGAAPLASCTQPVNCSGVSYGGDCIASDDHMARGALIAAAPAPAPVAVTPPPALAAPRPAVPYGEPATFAETDDKQCRSYGLAFGTHDYADCRIKLSAQHRGLAPGP